MSDKFIDIEKVIGSKSPKLLKYMPQFMLNYVKRIVHQDELNSILNDIGHLHGYDFCEAVIERFNIKVDIQGLENIPKEGGIVFASNHPFGGIEALAHIHSIYPIRPDVKFVVNDILMNLHNLKEFFVGVNKHGSTPKKALQELNELFGSGQAVFIYPAGLVSRKIKGKIQDTEWKKTFVSRSKSFDNQIIPVYTGGSQLSSFFYNLSNIRKQLGIKANIEMFYLVDEMMKQRNSTIKLVFGEPISTKTFDRSKSDEDWTKWVRNKVYTLEEQITY